MAGIASRSRRCRQGTKSRHEERCREPDWRDLLPRSQEVRRGRLTSETIEFLVTIRNRYGLHARPAAKFVELCNRFTSDVHVHKDGVRVNGKNILDIMTLGAAPGSELSIRVEGVDATDSAAAIRELFETNFGEE